MNRTIQCVYFFNVLTILEKQFSRLKSVYVKEEGLKGSDVSVLMTLYIHPRGLRHDEISRRTGADKAQISRSLKALREHGFIEQQASGIYKARYALTPSGRLFTEKVVWQASRIFEEAQLLVDEDQWRNFCRMSSDLSHEFEKEIRRKNEERRRMNQAETDLPVQPDLQARQDCSSEPDRPSCDSSGPSDLGCSDEEI